jgi:hypothetical protein
MKTLADIKKAMRLGTKWRMIHCGYPPHFKSTDHGIREVSIVQTNAIAFRTDSGSDSWLQWPKAKQIRFFDDNSNKFCVLDDDSHYAILCYERAENERQ